MYDHGSRQCIHVYINYLFKKLGIKIRPLPLLTINLYKQNTELNVISLISLKQNNILAVRQAFTRFYHGFFWSEEMLF